jgi:dihydroneopterin aldolase/2-amino-4-hydroxy-6-hydroxymethyldihydropteridine diphosphokinase/dihydropteroate synthase
LAVIALGSNLGDRFANIEAALYLLEHPELIPTPPRTFACTVINTSFLYETAPMYVTDQPSFLNCACIVCSFFFFLTLCHYHSHPVLQVRTDALPYALLETLKAIEHTVGRVPSIPNGPRAVDLDILFYDDAFFDSRPVSVKGTLEGLEGQLVIPHPRMAEREFVLRPLYELALSLPFHDQPLTVRAV